MLNTSTLVLPGISHDQPSCANVQSYQPAPSQCQSSSQNNCNQQTLADLQLPTSTMEQIRINGHTTQPPNHLNHMGPSTSHQPIYSVIGEFPNNIVSVTECNICCENAIDSALYMCGHMCMCYTCAIQQWRKGGGHCPICRAPIKDVIRIYKS